MEIKKQKKQVNEVSIRLTTDDVTEILKKHIKETNNINVDSVSFNIGTYYEEGDWRRINPLYELRDVVCKGYEK